MLVHFIITTLLSLQLFLNPCRVYGSLSADPEEWVDHLWDFEELIRHHNARDVLQLPADHPGANWTAHVYKPWSPHGEGFLTIKHIAKDAVKAKLAVNTYEVDGNIDNLIFNLNRKMLLSSKQIDKTTTFNIAFFGGSVCKGVNCLFASPMYLNLSITEHDKVESWCSWSRRFVEYFQSAISTIMGDRAEVEVMRNGTSRSSSISSSDSSRSSSSSSTSSHDQLVVTSRVCAAGGTTSARGTMQIHGKEYWGRRCGNAVDYKRGIPVESHWEPDLVIWDYSVNEENPALFRGITRKAAFEEFIKTVEHMPSKPQLIIVDNLHSKNGGAALERAALTKQYNVPHINYMKLFSSPANSKRLMPNSVFYAAEFKNNHPAFPTHMVWAQYVAISIFSRFVTMTKWRFNENGFGGAVNGDADISHSNNMENISDVIKITVDIKFVDASDEVAQRHYELGDIDAAAAAADNQGGEFCPMGFTSLYDYDGGNDASRDQMMIGQTGDTAKPTAISLSPFLAQKGPNAGGGGGGGGGASSSIRGWSFGADSPSRPDKTGWSANSMPPAINKGSVALGGECSRRATIERLWGGKNAPLLHSVSDINDSKMWAADVKAAQAGNALNAISFRCNTPLLGAVQLGYLCSYGEEWGIAQVYVKRTIYSTSGGIDSKETMLEERESWDPHLLVLNSKWSGHVSLLEEENIRQRNFTEVILSSKLVAGKTTSLRASVGSRRAGAGGRRGLLATNLATLATDSESSDNSNSTIGSNSKIDSNSTITRSSSSDHNMFQVDMDLSEMKRLLSREWKYQSIDIVVNMCASKRFKIVSVGCC